VVASLELRDLAVELELEVLGVALEVGDHLISARVAVRVARKCNSGKPAVAPRREQRQRVPALAPGRSDLPGALEDEHAPALTAEEMGDRQAGLPCSDDGDLVARSRLRRHQI